MFQKRGGYLQDFGATKFRVLIWGYFFTIVFLLIPTAGQAACPDSANNAGYVRAGATGTNSGSDWTNAYTDLPASLTRGCTYYVAAGTYAPHTFADAVSGTTRITVQAPTAANHGTNTGWNGSTMIGQALWQATSNGGPIWDVSQENYVTFNGSYCTPLANYPNLCTSGYGFKLDTAGHSISGNTGNDCVLCGIVQGGYGALGSSATYMDHDVTIQYVEVYGSNRSASMGDSSPADAAFSFTGGSYDLLFDHVYAHHNTWMFFLRGNHQGGQVWAPGCGCNITIQYSYLYWDGAGTDPSAPHGTPLDESEGIQNYTVRYNIIVDMGGSGTGTGGTSNGPDTASGGDYNSGNGNGGPWYYYGNLTYSDTSQKCASGDGMMAIYDFSMTNGDVWFVNNTFANMGYHACPGAVEATYGIGIGYTTPFHGWYEENNLWYDADLSSTNGSDVLNNGLTSGGTQGGGATFSPATVHGYDAWYYSPNTAANDKDSNKQNSPSSTSPFVSLSSYNFNLAVDTAAGITLSNVGTYWNGSTLVANTFNMDMLGTTRGANGTWDRGALQIAGVSAGAPNPPQNLKVTSVQ